MAVAGLQIGYVNTPPDSSCKPPFLVILPKRLHRKQLGVSRAWPAKCNICAEHEGRPT